MGKKKGRGGVTKIHEGVPIYNNPNKTYSVITPIKKPATTPANSVPIVTKSVIHSNLTKISTSTPAKSATNKPAKPNPDINPNLTKITTTSNLPAVRKVEFKSGVGVSVKTTVVVKPQEPTSGCSPDGEIEKVANASPKASALQDCCEYALLITDDIRRSIVMGTPHTSARQRLNRRDFWHKFVIINGCKYYKDYILKLILDQLSFQCDLIPVMYQKADPNTFFYARNCNAAVEKLCRLNFIIPMNNSGTTSIQQQIMMQLVLTAQPVSKIPGIIQDKAIQNALDKRYKMSTKALNLKDFHNDTALSDAVFLPLSRPSIMMYVLNCAKSLKYIASEAISLADNELTSLKNLDALWNFKSLRSLNLGYNKIPCVEELAVLKFFPLTDLVLDNNPLCQEFTNEAAYVKIITEMFPSLRTLDGIVLGNSSGMPQPCRNFLITPEGGPLADQFLQHYFTLFDEADRRKLLGIYHPNAIFSMTALYLPGQSTSANARLTEYMVHSRNLQKLSDYSKAQHLMITGAEAVIRHLCRLPKTWHDPHTFTVDLANYSVVNKLASLMVCGVFREANGLVRAFTRTFLLTCVATDEWQIINEMWHVTNARTDDAKQAFRILREPAALPQVTILNRSDREQMTEILSQLTDMNKIWATKCLDDTKWDFKDALATFTELYKLGNIPTEAFEKSGTTQNISTIQRTYNY